MDSKRFEMLDALRGIAALAVVAFHLGTMKIKPGFAPHGYLAVDFFFILSGFVIAHVYAGPLTASLTFREFAFKRFVRLYPLYFVGAAFGLTVLLMKWGFAPGKVESLKTIIISGFLNICLLPSFTGSSISHFELFPGNGPLWSLFFEVFINLAWAAFAIRVRTSTVLIFALASGLALSFAVFSLDGLNIGFDQQTFLSGFVRVGYGFSLGVLVHRVYPLLPKVAVSPVVLITVLLFAMAAPGNGFGIGRGAWDVLCATVVLPSLVVLGINQISAGPVGRWLGDLSYPIYVVHFPLLALASGLRQTSLARVDQNVFAICTMCSVVGLALVASRLYDVPTRRWLAGVARRYRDAQSLYRENTQQPAAPPAEVFSARPADA